MKIRLLLAGCALVLGACAEDSSFHIPMSSDNPPPPNAVVDQHCMDDCMSDKSDPGFCHDRCAK
jgi:hypothetical protein